MARGGETPGISPRAKTQSATMARSGVGRDVHRRGDAQHLTGSLSDVGDDHRISTEGLALVCGVVSLGAWGMRQLGC